VTAFVWYAFGAVPLHIAVSEQLHLSVAQTSSWIFVVWASGAVSSIALSVYYRQPIPITWTIPGLIYLGTLAGRFTFAELVGANLVAGLLLLGLGLLGVGARIMKWLPLPIIMGMFGGSILAYVTRMVAATVQDFAIAGVTVGGYLLGRLLNNPRVPPVGLAVTSGAITVALAGTSAGAPTAWTLPTLVLPEMSFSVSAIIAVSLPMVVLAMGLGNVQGLGFLLAQGYRVPVNTVSTVVGINSVVNALLGGHPATVARTGVAILAAPDAGPPSGRFWAVVVSAALTVVLALTATPVASLLAVLPKAYIFALAGVAIVSSLQDALAKSFGGEMQFGALVAFAVAATPFAAFGVTSAFWAIVAGLGASLLVERRQLTAFWKKP
jgi:benzoate membrane transport protein